MDKNQQEDFSWENRQVLVTGGSGFIGSYLVEALIAAGAKVSVLVRSESDSSQSNVRQWQYIDQRKGDLSRPDSLAGACSGVECVFHLAGYAHAEDVSASLHDSPHWRITVQGTEALLKEACKAGVRRLVFMSSVKAMGEGDAACLDETSPAVPQDHYGIAKREAEQMVLAAGTRCGMHVAILRVPMVYGRHNAGNLPRMIAAIRQGRFPPLPDTHNRRSMVHVEDAVQALLLAASRHSANGEIYLITDDECYSARRLYTSICAALGRRLPGWSVPPWLLSGAGYLGDIFRKAGLPAPLTTQALHKFLGSAWYSCAKAKRDLGYRPHRKLEDALPEMLDSRWGERHSVRIRTHL